MSEEVAENIGSDETRELVANFQTAIGNIRNQIRGTIVGQDEVVDSLLITLFVGGHCLITGMPGTAKTLLVHTLASALGLSFKRIQFTPDLMPTDITGTDMVEEDQSTGHREWRFIQGPVFTNVLLADEINRTPPKTQAALLEAMQEKTVTVRGQNHVLDKPFIVLATQNPIELEGTYPLPEAQLDRFLFNVILDYLDAEQEVAVIDRFTKSVEMPPVEACTTAEEIIQFQSLVREVPISDSLSRYAVDIVRATRPSDDLATDMIKKYANFGSSIRATMNLVLAAKTRALMEGRYHVIDEDLRALAIPILRHRVLPNYYAESDGITIDDILADMLTHIKVND
ncbi:MAG: AAA family ATPase [Gammaproteobacteria bacterium]|nr:AAA family ATPase [Gammaproteobacteria bacterium]|tara:strand:+ start:113565 stop:114590 length:1026 start_codon:yes stop_codon:yes gene_type:complete